MARGLHPTRLYYSLAICKAPRIGPIFKLSSIATGPCPANYVRRRSSTRLEHTRKISQIAACIKAGKGGKYKTWKIYNPLFMGFLTTHRFSCLHLLPKPPNYLRRHTSACTHHTNNINQIGASVKAGQDG